MSDIVIRVENLSKKYTIRHANGRHTDGGLRHALQHAATAPWRMLRQQLRRPTSDVRHLISDSPLPTSDLRPPTSSPSPLPTSDLRPQTSENSSSPASSSPLTSDLRPLTSENSSRSEEFFALRDVSFEVKRGEVLGIIGRNGAGKSTLLKILSRITEPTSGRIGIKGRVASLLEVGTGFHQELTGRENIFLNGAILGMSRVEVRQKFDEIVNFAEVEQFLDTPVKRYSSGMYVRLAFAVAAHLEPEILIVDEVLAVGDVEFQKKCMGKMDEVAKRGRTVLFVSHNMEAIQRLTSTCLLLVNGKNKCLGSTALALKEYRTQRSGAVTNDIDSYRSIICSSFVKIANVQFGDVSGNKKIHFLPTEDVYLYMAIHHEGKDPLSCEIAFAIESDSYTPIMASHYSDLRSPIIIDHTCQMTVPIKPNILRHGHYYISMGIYSRDFRLKYDELLHMPAFEVDGFDPTLPRDERWGLVYLPFAWTVGGSK